MKQGFTLLEVLISIALLSIVMLALNKSVTLLRDSNTKLFEHLDKAKEETKMLNVLYADISASNGDISIEKKEFSRLCINETIHSLYELPSANVITSYSIHYTKLYEPYQDVQTVWYWNHAVA